MYTKTLWNVSEQFFWTFLITIQNIANCFQTFFFSLDTLFEMFTNKEEQKAREMKARERKEQKMWTRRSEWKKINVSRPIRLMGRRPRSFAVRYADTHVAPIRARASLARNSASRPFLSAIEPVQIAKCNV
jgi:hypothetical protein